VCDCEVCRKLDSLSLRAKRADWASDLREVHEVYRFKIERSEFFYGKEK
jgi:hypothetical protein